LASVQKGEEGKIINLPICFVMAKLPHQLWGTSGIVVQALELDPETKQFINLFDLQTPDQAPSSSKH
jgi:hypothetical protein